VKEQCIWAEHRLSRYIEQENGIHAYPGKIYPWVHRVDRLLAAKRRMQHLWKA
jgi:superfamily II helicase